MSQTIFFLLDQRRAVHLDSAAHVLRMREIVEIGIREDRERAFCFHQRSFA